jgi:hemoglobin
MRIIAGNLHRRRVDFGMTAAPLPTHYALVGGEAGVRALVDRFYDLMDAAPEAADIRALHATNLTVSREKLFKFLSGWLGGPQLYVAAHGQPMLRARHLPFPIAERERDQWLWCMRRALDGHEMPEELRAFLWQRFTQLADHMRNR